MKKLASGLLGLIMIAMVPQTSNALTKANKVSAICGAECVDISITPAECESYHIKHVDSTYYLNAHCSKGFRAHGLGDPKYDNDQTLNFAPAHEITYAISSGSIKVLIGDGAVAERVRPNNIEVVKKDIRGLITQAANSVDKANRPVYERTQSLKDGLLGALK